MTGTDVLTSPATSDHDTTIHIGSGSAPGPDPTEPSRGDRYSDVRIAIAIACLLGTQFLHWRVIDAHAQEWAASGTFFFVLALVEGSLTILLVTRRRPSVVAASIMASVVPLMIWAWDRTLGLPVGPTRGVRGTIGRSDVMSVVFEVLTVVVLWPLVRPHGLVRRHSRLDPVGRIVVGATCLYVAGFSMWAVLGDQNAVHHATAPTVSVVDDPGPADDAPLNSGIPVPPTQP